VVGVLGRVWWVVVAVGVVVGVGGCGGGGGLPAGVAVQVGGRSISEASLVRWTRVEGALASDVGAPGGRSFGWAMPEPPAYTACIRVLEQAERRPAGTAKKVCEETYLALRGKILAILVGMMWDEGIAAEKGIAPSETELDQQERAFIQREYPQPGAFQQYLAATGLTRADERLRIKRNLLELKLREKQAQEYRAVAGDSPREREARLKLGVQSTSKWLEKTNCRPGYIVIYCRQYRGVQRF